MSTFLSLVCSLHGRWIVSSAGRLMNGRDRALRVRSVGWCHGVCV